MSANSYGIFLKMPYQIRLNSAFNSKFVLDEAECQFQTFCFVTYPKRMVNEKILLRTKEDFSHFGTLLDPILLGARFGGSCVDEAAYDLVNFVIGGVCRV